MITENLSTLKIHKLTEAQYDREFNAGNIDETALYLTPDEKTVGKNVEGIVHTIDGVEVTAGIGAEIFNNYKYNIATGNYSHAEGCDTKAVGGYSHAEGYFTTASGNIAHTEGEYTIASGWASHAEGSGVNADGWFSHAEGEATKTTGQGSHAEGFYTLASSDYQHVQGKYNIEDTDDKYAHIVGNGEANNRSNAHTVDWDGNGWFAGNVECSYMILQSPNGTRFKITVDDSGNLSTNQMA